MLYQRQGLLLVGAVTRVNDHGTLFARKQHVVR
jgi:hypothetical protein